MAQFVIDGPFPVPIKRSKGGGRFVDGDKWRSLADLSVGFSERGCYVFSVKTSKGELPIYVGMTKSQTLLNEAFNSTNRLRVSEYISEIGHGTLRLYLVYEGPKGRGAKNWRCIPEIEGFLVGLCSKRNEKLINIRKTKAADWSIKGVVRAGSGKHTNEELEFRRLIGVRGLDAYG